MKHILKVFICLAIVMAIIPGGAQAANLTQDKVGKFVTAIPDVEVFSESMRKSGKDKQLEEAVKPEKNETKFTPYTKGVALMKTKFPEDYKSLSDISKKSGFSSAEDWASTGDNVMMAYMANKIEAQNPNALKEIKDITPEMKAKMAPPMVAQMERAIKMMKIVSATPVEDRAAVKPHAAAIDGWLERSMAKEKAEAEAAKAKQPAAKADPKAKPKTTP